MEFYCANLLANNRMRILTGFSGGTCLFPDFSCVEPYSLKIRKWLYFPEKISNSIKKIKNMLES